MNSYMRSVPAIAIMAAAVIFFAIDFAEQMSSTDYPFEWHHLLEWIVFAGVMYFVFKELRRLDALRRTAQEQAQTIHQLSGHVTEHIEATFANWELSAAEQDISWLLIKGFSFAEVAEIRNVREKSVRQQASSIYRKAGVKGRSELVAYFLEDLISQKLQPDEENPPALGGDGDSLQAPENAVR